MRYFQWLLAAVLVTSLVGVATAISQFDRTQIIEVVSALPSSCAVLGLAIAVCYSQQLEDEGESLHRRSVCTGVASRECGKTGCLATISEEKLYA